MGKIPHKNKIHSLSLYGCSNIRAVSMLGNYKYLDLSATDYMFNVSDYV